MDKKTKRIVLHGLIIFLITAALYAPSLKNGFIWDDDDYVTENRLVQEPGGIKDIWFSFETPQYYPLVFSSFWLEHKLWGLAPMGYHAVNLAIHILNAFFLYLVVRRLAPSLAFATAIVFAVHPVQVETVAWITERKNLLGVLFYLLTIYFYLAYTATPRKGPYLLSLLCFVAALLSKSIAVTFVFFPLVYIWWQKQRIDRHTWATLTPFVALGAVSGLTTIWLEIHRVGAHGKSWDLSFLQHVILPGKIVWFYILKLVFPGKLIFFYPRWQLDPGQAVQWAPLAALLAVLFLLYRYRSVVGRGGFAVFVYFVLSLLPALGIFRVYPMKYSFVADHFQYLAGMAMILFLVAAARFGFETIALKVAPSLASHRVAVMYGTLLAIVGVFGWKTMTYTRVYADAKTLWVDVIEKNPGAWMAHNNLGYLYMMAGKREKAVEQFEKTLSIKPGDEVALNNLGTIFQENGQMDRARAAFEASLRTDPGYASAHNNIGKYYAAVGDAGRAVAAYKAAAKLDPRAHLPHLNLGNAYLRMKDYPRAVAAYERARQLYDRDPIVYVQLGIAHAETGQMDAALSAFRQGAAIDPKNPRIFVNIGAILETKGDFPGAANAYRKAVGLNPGFGYAHYNLADVLLRLGRKDTAVFHFRRARQLGFTLPAHAVRLIEASGG